MSAHKIREIYQYSEDVYYDDDGNEVARERQYDDYLYDTTPAEELTEEEREDRL